MTPEEARKIIASRSAVGEESDDFGSDQPDQPEMTPEQAREIVERRSNVAGSTLSEHISAFARSGTGGFVENAPVLAGMAAGGAAGSAFGPWGTAGGALLGAVAGSPAGEYIKEKIKSIPGAKRFVSDPAEEPEALRPAAYGGRVVGGSMPFAMAPFAAARAGVESASPYVQGVLKSVAREPAAFAANEMTGISGSAVGSMIAQEVWPDKPWPRLAGEVLGGFVHPTSLVGRITGPAIQESTTAARSILSQSGKMDRASLAVKRALDTAGEDPETLVKMLREETLAGRPTTSAAKTGSPTLNAIERQLSDMSAKFGDEQKARVHDNLEALRLMATRLEESGNPEALKEAAKLRQRRFEAALDASAALRAQEAATSAAAISKDSPQAMGEISQAAFNALRKSLTEARAAERELWEKVPKDIRIAPTNFMESYDAIRARMMPEQKLPRIVEDFQARAQFGDPKQPVTTGDMKALRSELLGMSRDAAAYGDWQNARRYGDLASSVLRDFEAVGEIARPLTDARAFSNALHDVYTRTFAGKALAKADTGAQRIEPELMIERALSGSGTGADVRSRQLREATRFLSRTGETAADMQAAQDRAIRLAAKEVVDPRTGRVNPIRAARFAQENAAILDDFPKIRADLETARGRENLFARIEKAHAEARKVAGADAAFAKILKTDDPALSVGRVLGGPAPVTSMEAFGKLAQKGGRDALNGLSTAVLQNARASATRPSGDFSFGRYWHTLTQPIHPGGPSQLDILKKYGAMSNEQIGRFTKIMDEAQKVERSLKGGAPVEDLLPESAQIYDFALRVLGANVEKIVPMAGSVGTPLVVAQAGSKLARNVFDRVPKNRVQDILIEASKNPKFMADLLERPITPRQKADVTKRIEAFLWNAGLVGFPNAMEEQQ